MLDNVDDGKVIKSKKRKIKQTNKYKNPKKVKSPIKNNDSTNDVTKQQILTKNHDDSASPLLLFRKSSKVIQNNRVKTKKTITFKGFMALNKNHDFGGLALK